jgi:hypothetical protein
LKLLELKALAAELQWQLALQRFGRKYRPDQARDERGRWVDEGRGEAEGNQNGSTDFGAAKRLPTIVKDFGKWTVRQYVSQKCRAEINRELPGQIEDVTIGELLDIAKGGDAAAKKCYKLLNQRRFQK